MSRQLPLARPGWVLAFVLAAAAGCGEMGSFADISVNIRNPGSGSGSVESVEANLDIECDLSPNDRCDDGFDEAGGGASFSLVATPSEGSVFVEWRGCTSANGNVCVLRTAQSDTTFNVTARFDESADGFFVTRVNIENLGSGAGQVRSDHLDPDCDLLPDGSPDSRDICERAFSDGGGGVSFSLEAIPNAGHTFAGWQGCTSTNLNVCFLSSSISDSTFNVTATFADPGSVRRALRGAR